MRHRSTLAEWMAMMLFGWTAVLVMTLTGTFLLVSAAMEETATENPAVHQRVAMVEAGQTYDQFLNQYGDDQLAAALAEERYREVMGE